MKSILEEFAYGNIAPCPCFFKKDSEYGKAIGVLADSEEKLLASLDEVEKALLERMTDAQAEVVSLTATDKFIYGYRLGVLMTMEVFEGKENLLAGGEGC